MGDRHRRQTVVILDSLAGRLDVLREEGSVRPLAEFGTVPDSAPFSSPTFSAAELLLPLTNQNRPALMLLAEKGPGGSTTLGKKVALLLYRLFLPRQI